MRFEIHPVLSIKVAVDYRSGLFDRERLADILVGEIGDPGVYVETLESEHVEDFVFASHVSLPSTGMRSSFQHIVRLAVGFAHVPRHGHEASV